MSAIFIMLLFATAFAAAVWTLYASVRPQLHRYRSLIAPVAVPELPMRVSRVTARQVPARMPLRMPLRAAA